jgi:hypothetical protein
MFYVAAIALIIGLAAIYLLGYALVTVVHAACSRRR